ncbi:MAG: cytochrome P450 [Pseudomonadales bacterium]|nr:cytochrome P450 [Pseudomonadales bacterium]MBO7007663.1 cytochrome P450 [Pseudomonadales bacterium]
MSWSPFKPDIIEDPANGHQHLLKECPVHHCEEFDPSFYTLSRYADVEEALRDIETYSSHWGQGPRFTEPAGMLADPPQHTNYRKLIQQAFTPKAVEALRPQVASLTDELIDTILDGPDIFDFHDQFAFPLPVIIIAGMLGVPSSDLDQFKVWSDMQVDIMGSEDPTKYMDEQMKFQAYMFNHMMNRRGEIEAGKDVPEDLLTMVAGARANDGAYIPDSDALSMLNQLLVGGNETTTSLITNLMWRLLEEPSRWQAIVNDESLIENAVEESLRFDPPVLGLYRTNTKDVELHGQVIPESSKIWINYAAANRDESVYENPDEFDMTRSMKRHMAFGLGVHFCIGAPTARLEAEVALRKLRERLPELELMDAGERIGPFFLWGRRTLPLRRR